ncbi:exodeoxyribonuclease iii family protein [Stylonychia lemnae]|uniref:DNA-(apurinic or apyrimidinic site) endonuclease n=1 Tax=Stylonychia lemnae TaxID=5949 RepID=A0A077ZXY2_STYLE|nr:exodeoxyribonuclease iii family protein [Stylonychia lemnae]|eukprot:CDW73391.1 exodeoxyribonuclease iii family protein [Stylonychia lemnae]
MTSRRSTKKRELQKDEDIKESHLQLDSKKSISRQQTNKTQSNLAGFFGITINKSAKFHGEAKHSDFPDSKVNIWHWNINGLSAVINKGMLQKFMEEAKPDIVCFNEIKTDLDKISSAKLHQSLPEGYEQYWNCSKTKKGYAGTGIVTRIKPISVEFDIGIDKHDDEGRVITAEFKDFTLVSVYVPNSGDDLRRLDYRTQEWDKDFFDYLDKIRTEKQKPLILTGDLNVARNELDIFDVKGKEKVACYTPQERASFQTFIDKGYVDTFRHLYPEKREYTYFSARTNAKASNKGWRIDYFMLHKDDLDMVVDNRIHKDFNGSDHVPIELEIDLTKKNKSQSNISKAKSEKLEENNKSKKKETKKSHSKSQIKQSKNDDESEDNKDEEDENNNPLDETKFVHKADQDKSSQEAEIEVQVKSQRIQQRAKKATKFSYPMQKKRTNGSSKLEIDSINDNEDDEDQIAVGPAMKSTPYNKSEALTLNTGKEQARRFKQLVEVEVEKRMMQLMANVGQTRSTTNLAELGQQRARISHEVFTEFSLKRALEIKNKEELNKQPQWDDEYKKYDDEY